MFDFLPGVAQGLIVALIISPAIVAYRFPEQFGSFADKVVSFIFIAFAIAFAACAGYAAGAVAERSGVAFTDAQVQVAMWGLLAACGAVMAYLFVLSRTVAKWAKDRNQTPKK